MLDVTAYPVVDTPHRDHPCHGISRAGWIVAVTHPHAELWAQTNLRTRGYNTFLPLHLVRRRDRVTPTITRTMLAPLWPGYCFVAYDSRDPRRPIRETPGVRDVIRCGSQVQWCPDGVVSALQATEDARRSLPPPGARWAPGTPCSLAQGPMRGFPAVVTHCDHDTATIACLFLGQLREITVPVDSLVARDE